VALERLDDPDHPTFGIGQAAELLEVAPAFLRSLDAAGLVRPARSAGGHRRYSRNQLDRVEALRELAEHGHSLSSAAEILDLRADLNQERARHARTTDERDRARHDRDTALAARDAALAERDDAVADRAAVFADRDTALAARNGVLANRDRAGGPATATASARPGGQTATEDDQS
jgi:MerR family transcriptional regulator, heat shock protein HspR